MFRHNKNTEVEGVKSSSSQEEAGGVAEVVANKIPPTEVVKAEPSLKELIEKNLKWSQIIYEQNRKINNKLLWTAIGNWLRLLLIIASLALGVIYLEPLLKGVLSQYGDLLGGTSTAGAKQNSMDSLLKLFTNLDPAKQEQLKTLLK